MTILRTLKQYVLRLATLLVFAEASLPALTIAPPRRTASIKDRIASVQKHLTLQAGDVQAPSYSSTQWLNWGNWANWNNWNNWANFANWNNWGNFSNY